VGAGCGCQRRSAVPTWLEDRELGVCAARFPLRGTHYRRRLQSAGIAGVPLASPWVVFTGVMSMNFGGGANVDGDNLARDMTDLGRRVLSAIASAMQTLLEWVEAAVAELQVQRGRPHRDPGAGELIANSSETI
jgi:hypothetical protein